MIRCKIDVNKIDRGKLFKGEKGLYLDIVLIESTNSQYGDDYMIVQDVTKEEREAGVKGAILGNAKIVARKQAPQRPAPAPAKPAARPASQEGLDEDVPF